MVLGIQSPLVIIFKNNTFGTFLDLIKTLLKTHSIFFNRNDLCRHMYYMAFWNVNNLVKLKQTWLKIFIHTGHYFGLCDTAMLKINLRKIEVS